MLRNIPNKYTQNSLLEEIHEAGFVDTYDFFYLPMDVHNRANVGYAFINFLESEDFDRFTAAFTDYVFRKHPSLKIARVSPAHIQGLVENLRHFSNRAVTWSRNSQYRPIVRYRGVHRDLCELLAELPLAEGEAQVPDAGLGDQEAAGHSDPPEEGPSHLNPQAAEFVPSSNPAGNSGVTERTGLRPDAGVFVPQAMLAMPEMQEIPDMPIDDAALLNMQNIPELCMGTEMDVAPPPGLEGLLYFGAPFFGCDEGVSPCEEPEHASLPPDCSSGEAAPVESFTLDKQGLQDAVSQWLREGQLAASAGGSSSTRSSSNGSTRHSLVETPPNLEKTSEEAA